jgi:hypothetical protein
VTQRLETAMLAIAFAIAGLVALTLVFAGPATYESLARDTPFAPATFHGTGGFGSGTTTVPLARLVDYHERWLAYVTGRAPSPPSEPGVVLFTPDEYAHMADVRRVFIGFQVAALAGVVVAVVLFTRAVRRGRRATLTLARGAAIAAGLGVAVIAVVAAVAFDPLFLAFHEVFFPQGNFLFGPDSNLIAIYPDAYWSGVTLRIGLAFVAATAIIAIAATATLRRSRR